MFGIVTGNGIHNTICDSVTGNCTVGCVGGSCIHATTCDIVTDTSTVDCERELFTRYDM